jgi:iron-sulfur cluster assembly accessory protein
MNTGRLRSLITTVSRKNAFTSSSRSLSVLAVPSLFVNRPCERQSFAASSRRTMVVVTQTRVEEIPSVVPQMADTPSAPAGDSSPLPDADAATTDGVLVTASCWKRIRALASKKQMPLDQLYLRVFVDAGGCSGFQYEFEISEEELEEDDVIFYEPVTAGGADVDIARVVVDKGSLDFLHGSHIDYVQEMIKSSFAVLDNPNSESACGCGSSFALKNFTSNPALD